MVVQRPPIAKGDRGCLVVVLLLMLACSCLHARVVYEKVSFEAPCVLRPVPSPLGGKDCTAPCWEGLVLGESTTAEVLAAVRSLKYVQQDTLTAREAQHPEPDAVWVTWRDRADRLHRAYLVSDRLRLLEHETGCVLEVRDVLQALGPPESYGYLRAFTSGRPEAEERTLTLCYPQRGVWVAAEPDGRVGVNPREPVLAIYYTHGMSMAKVFWHMGTDANDAEIAQAVAEQRPWRGYGPVWEQTVTP